MKENWIKKLIELLNQFEKERESWFTWRSIDSYDNCVYGVDCDWETEITMYSDLYSKYYGFIKRLVENDKIETNHLSLQAFKNIFSGGWFVKVSDLEVLLMLLSISNTPIEDLISYLK
jgi:hypothetical protein